MGGSEVGGGREVVSHQFKAVLRGRTILYHWPASYDPDQNVSDREAVTRENGNSDRKTKDKRKNEKKKP